MKQHPLILAHDQTFYREFPLVLIVGREPNNKGVSNGKLGLMHFEKWRRCAFWNVAFGMLGRLVGKNLRDIKSEFLNRKSSPLLFTDACSQGIHNSVLNKHEIRLSQKDAVFLQVETIMSYEDILNRICLVILSGLQHQIYSEFKNLISNKMTIRNIPIIETPFFYPTNTSKIMDSLTNDSKTILKNVYNTFINETAIEKDILKGKLNEYDHDAPDTDEGIIPAHLWTN